MPDNGVYLDPMSVRRFFTSLNFADRGVDLAVRQGLYLEAEQLMAKSVRLVPVDSGTLRASAVVLSVERRGDHYVVEFGYGGAASDYALWVHERPLHHAHGKNKFLELPMNNHASLYGASLAAKIMSALRRQGI